MVKLCLIEKYNKEALSAIWAPRQVYTHQTPFEVLKPQNIISLDFTKNKEKLKKLKSEREKSTNIDQKGPKYRFPYTYLCFEVKNG